ncbi:MAG: hypothetical protein JSW40_06045 [Candidatus Omnitrophota bacterium]|nr:MAG: hypothetical protein JSW40_06045 [Candidatus Omnitrophota bacterium]
MKRSITFVELAVSITLLVVIILGVSAFDVASKRFLRSSETRTTVLNEMTFVLDHLHRNVLEGAGDINNPGLDYTAPDLTINQEAGSVVYTFDLAQNQIRFRNQAGNLQTLTQRFVPDPDSGFIVAIEDGGVRITGMAIRFDPGSAQQDEFANPLATLVDVTGNRTVYFFPLSHSWR